MLSGDCRWLRLEPVNRRIGRFEYLAFLSLGVLASLGSWEAFQDNCLFATFGSIILLIYNIFLP